MILVNTVYISGKELEMLGLVKGSTIQSKHLGKDIAQAFKIFIKAPTRFELVIEVLQPFALPLGHGAILNYM